jgi:hypothetical protein
MKCGHYDAHTCKHCGRCNSCLHTYIKRADGWYKRCPDLKWRKVVKC